MIDERLDQAWVAASEVLNLVEEGLESARSLMFDKWAEID